MKDVAVVAYCRTGIAKAQGGALNQTHGIAMAAHVLRSAVKRAGVDPAEIETPNPRLATGQGCYRPTP